jgi:hypothetical protein
MPKAPLAACDKESPRRSTWAASGSAALLLERLEIATVLAGARNPDTLRAMGLQGALMPAEAAADRTGPLPAARSRLARQEGVAGILVHGLAQCAYSPKERRTDQYRFENSHSSLPNRLSRRKTRRRLDMRQGNLPVQANQSGLGSE